MSAKIWRKNLSWIRRVGSSWAVQKIWTKLTCIFLYAKKWENESTLSSASGLGLMLVMQLYWCLEEKLSLPYGFFCSYTPIYFVAFRKESRRLPPSLFPFLVSEPDVCVIYRCMGRSIETVEKREFLEETFTITLLGRAIATTNSYGLLWFQAIIVIAISSIALLLLLLRSLSSITSGFDGGKVRFTGLARGL